MTLLHRCVIAPDATGVARILATDSAHLACDIRETGTACDDLGFEPHKEFGTLAPGLYLWEGRAVPHVAYPDYHTEYTWNGVLTALADLTLLQMAPPPPPDEDRETIAEGDAHYYHKPPESPA